MLALRGTAIVVLVLWIVLDGSVVFRRRAAGSENRDRFSMRVLLAGNMLAWAAGIGIAYSSWGAIQPAVPVQIAGFALLGAGILMRSVAIAQLGRFHTPNVAIFADHALVERGLYRRVRHPSYAGALLAFSGFGLALANWLSLLIIVGVAAAAYLYRIHEEEAALMAALGEAYRAYCRRTWRLIPGIY